MHLGPSAFYLHVLGIIKACCYLRSTLPLFWVEMCVLLPWFFFSFFLFFLYQNSYRNSNSNIPVIVLIVTMT